MDTQNGSSVPADNAGTDNNAAVRRGRILVKCVIVYAVGSPLLLGLASNVFASPGPPTDAIVGFVFAAFGMLVLAYVIGRVLIQGRVVPGFAFTASAIAIFSGAQLFAIGIIGEYLARMHFRLMERPPYAVRGRVGGPED